MLARTLAGRFGDDKSGGHVEHLAVRATLPCARGVEQATHGRGHRAFREILERDVFEDLADGSARGNPHFAKVDRVSGVVHFFGRTAADRCEGPSRARMTSATLTSAGALASRK